MRIFLLGASRFFVPVHPSLKRACVARTRQSVLMFAIASVPGAVGSGTPLAAAAAMDLPWEVNPLVGDVEGVYLRLPFTFFF